MEAMRCLKRRLSDIVHRQLVNDQKRLRQKADEADPGGQAWAATGSSAAVSNPECWRFREVTCRARQRRLYASRS
jgi:transposase